MRELKFKAWDVKLNQWVPETEDGFGLVGEVMLFSVIENYIQKNLTGAKSSLERIGDIRFVQFVGLYDKHGEPIYEGSIIDPDFGNGFEGVVEYYPKGAMYWIIMYRPGRKKRHYKLVGDELGNGNDTRLMDRTIVGHVFENPGIKNE